jgi:hypothetical protein
MFDSLSLASLRDMQAKMEWTDPFHYHPERGLYYHEVAPRVFCGTQPRSPTDMETLRSRLGITAILNLQTDSDMQVGALSSPSSRISPYCSLISPCSLSHDTDL